MEKLPEDPVQATARLFARLTHRFADREAILERNGFSDHAFDEHERRTIQKLLDANPSVLCAFAATFVKSRAELLGVEHAAKLPLSEATIDQPVNTEKAPVLKPEKATVKVILPPDDEFTATLQSSSGKAPPTVDD